MCDANLAHYYLNVRRKSSSFQKLKDHFHYVWEKCNFLIYNWKVNNNEQPPTRNNYKDVMTIYVMSVWKATWPENNFVKVSITLMDQFHFLALIIAPFLTISRTKDENIGIDGNIEGQKYGNIGGNIGEISISIKLWKKWWKFIKKYGNF